jgi:hypothetical protein
MRLENIPRMINLENSDYQIVREMAEERGLGEKGLSAAIRRISRLWHQHQLQDPICWLIMYCRHISAKLFSPVINCKTTLALNSDVKVRILRALDPLNMILDFLLHPCFGRHYKLSLTN